jgi:hypothetical protein
MADAEKPDDMTEEELATFYEERKGDVSLWKSKPRKIRVRRGSPSTVFALRLAPEELEQLYRAAQAQGTNLSAFIRDAALEKAQSAS